MIHNNTAARYKAMEVNTSDRLKLILMVYDAAISSVKQARVCHDKRDIIGRNRYVSRAQLIINELNNALDVDRGGEIASNLRRVYLFINRYLC
jgi:flagellar protein FliS